MEGNWARFVRASLSDSEVAEMARVDVLASQVALHLESSTEEIRAAHVHGAQSSEIQAIVSRLLKDQVGFSEEVLLTPQEGFVTSARPDFVFRLGPGRGILAEVERGGTVNNHHDLKDFWKAHVAPDAQHLFLIVPFANWKPSGQPRERPFIRVSNRLSAFFGDSRREVDVLSAHVFGYGSVDHSG